MTNYWPLLQALYAKNKALLATGVVDDVVNSRINKLEKSISNWNEYYGKFLYVSYTTFYSMMLTLPISFSQKLSFEIEGEKFRLIKDKRGWRQLEKAYLIKMSEVNSEFEKEALSASMKDALTWRNNDIKNN